jgi:acyl-CoA thioester hydrolase
MAFVKRVEIRWRDLDGFLHVNNAVYLTYLEETRDEFYMGLLDHDTVDRMVLRHTSVDYQRALGQADEHVDVELRVLKVGSSSVTTRETIRSLATGEIAAVAESVMVHCDAHRSSSQPFDDEARRRLEGEL